MKLKLLIAAMESVRASLLVAIALLERGEVEAAQKQLNEAEMNWRKAVEKIGAPA